MVRSLDILVMLPYLLVMNPDDLPPQPLSSGCHHVAMLTEDLDRFIDFYRSVFEARVVAELEEEGMRHALVDLGGGFHLHPFQLPRGSGSVARASGEMFRRGHLDHLAVNVGDPGAFETIRQRLVERGASDGTITDFGLVQTVSFDDPDGMDAEIAIAGVGEIRRFDQRRHNSGPLQFLGGPA